MDKEQADKIIELLGTIANLLDGVIYEDGEGNPNIYITGTIDGSVSIDGPVQVYESND